MNAVLLILMICVTLFGMNGFLLSPVLTDIAEEYHISVTVAGQTIAAYSAGTAMGAFLLGRSLDGFGFTRALVWALAIVCLAQVASGFAQSWLVLIAAQASAGMAAGVALPAIYGITAEISPKGQESKYMSKVIFGWSIALVAAVPIGAFVSDLLGWRQMLMLAGGISLLMVVFALKLLPANKPVQARIKMKRLKPLFLPGGWVQYTICLFFMMSFYGSFAYFGDYMRATFSLTATGAGLAALFYGTGFGLAAFAAKIIDSFGRNKVLPAGLGLAFVLLSTVWISGELTVFLGVVFFWGVVNHFILNMIVVGLNALAPENRGAVMGLYSAVTYTGAAIGVTLMGFMYGGVGFAGVAMTSALLNFGAMILALVTSAKNPDKLSR